MHTLVLKSPGAIFFTLGPLVIRWYGVMIVLGFLVALVFMLKKAKQKKIHTEELLNLACICFVAGVLGARLYFVALNWHFYMQHPNEILATWLGGMSIHGGIIGGFIAGYIYALRKKLPKRLIADLFGCVIPCAQAIGRWGNFFNSEAFGLPVKLGFPIALYIPYENRPLQFKSCEYFQPTFLYESIWNLVVFFILYFVLYKKLERLPGVTFLAYLIFYSIGRIVIEPLRLDSIMAGTLPVPIIASWLTMFIASACIPYFIRLAKKNS